MSEHTGSEQSRSALRPLAEAVAGTYWEDLGGEVESLTAERVVVSLEVHKRHLNHVGIVHGGVLATLMDSAMGLAVMLIRPGTRVVTTNLHLHFVAPATAGKLIVAAEQVHASRRLVTMQATARGSGGEIYAFASGTFHSSEHEKHRD